MGAARCRLVPYAKAPQQVLAAQLPHVGDYRGSIQVAAILAARTVG